MSDVLPDLLRYVPVLESAKAAVLDRLNESHRHYHNLEHVVEMWRWHTEYAPTEFDAIDRQIIASFCLYHDAIYDPQAHDNEQRSAALWLDDSYGCMPPLIGTAVNQVILATTDHFRWRSTLTLAPQSWCIDLDLLRLGSSRFTQHGHDIRAEYQHMTDLQWLNASAKFRCKVMAQSQIFQHAEFAAMEVQARHNLAQALLRDWQALGYLT